MKRNLLIIGASGHGRVVAEIALKMNIWRNIAFLDDDENLKTTMGIDIIGKSVETSKYSCDYEMFVAIGNNERREKFQSRLEIEGANIPILIHPNAVIGKDVTIGAGSVMMANVVINCCSTIGKGCIINTGATIDHDNVIGDFVHVSPGAHLAGTVSVGKGTWIGIGAAISNNINITGDCMIGAGSVVIRDITNSGTYVGMPARVIQNG